MKRWVVSGVASIIRGGTVHIRHEAFSILASSEAEAEGLSLQIMKKGYPPSAGWQDHSVAAKLLTDANVDPNADIKPITEPFPVKGE